MFGRKAKTDGKTPEAPRKQSASPAFIEILEGRQLLSAAVVHHTVHAHVAHHATTKHASLKHAAGKAATTTSTGSTTSSSSTSGTGAPASGDGDIIDTITFSQAPSTVQTGLTTLASADSLTAPTSTQTVYLGNSNGLETFTLKYTACGTTTRITVDQNGNAVTAPAESTITWATLSGTGAGSNAAAAVEISAIATALSLAAPTSTTTVSVSTPSSGATTYTVMLAASSSMAMYAHDTVISVDSNGNPVGRESLPFSVIPTAIQNGFNSNLPAGASALPTTSTQTVDVLTANGITFYSTTFTASGTTSTVTVNSLGALISLPSTMSTTFSDIPLAAQTGLQTLATADGVTGTIAAGQAVTEYTESNGTVIYSITLSSTNSASETVTITLSSDQFGNPTVPPENHGCCGGHERRGWDENDASDFGAVDFGLASFGGGRY